MVTVTIIFDQISSHPRAWSSPLIPNSTLYYSYLSRISCEVWGHNAEKDSVVCLAYGYGKINKQYILKEINKTGSNVF